MKPVVLLAAFLPILLLNVAATIRVVRYGLFTALNKTAWILCVWCAPFLGSLLALQATSESRRAPPAGQSFGAGLGDPSGAVLGNYGGSHFGGDHCGGGGHSGDVGGCGGGDGGSGH